MWGQVLDYLTPLPYTTLRALILLLDVPAGSQTSTYISFQGSCSFHGNFPAFLCCSCTVSDLVAERCFGDRKQAILWLQYCHWPAVQVSVAQSSRGGDRPHVGVITVVNITVVNITIPLQHLCSCTTATIQHAPRQNCYDTCMYIPPPLFKNRWRKMPHVKPRFQPQTINP